MSNEQRQGRAWRGQIETQQAQDAPSIHLYADDAKAEIATEDIETQLIPALDSEELPQTDDFTTWPTARLQNSGDLKEEGDITAQPTARIPAANTDIGQDVTRIPTHRLSNSQPMRQQPTSR
jgi:hypothetical protein